MYRYTTIFLSDESAFVSRDKLKHTPTELASMTYTKAPPAANRGTPLQKATRTLFANTPMVKKGQGDQPDRIQDDAWKRGTPQEVRTTPKEARVTPKEVRATPKEVTPKEVQATTQGVQRQQRQTDVSISNLLNLSNGSNTFPSQEDNYINEDYILQMGEYVHLKDDSGTSDNDVKSSPADVWLDNYEPELRRTGSSTNTPVSSKSASIRTDLTPTSLPLEDLEQTLLEITRTKTPQLPLRSRQRVRQVSSILEEEEDDREHDLITSTRLSLGPMLVNTSLGDFSPASKETSESAAEKVARTSNGLPMGDAAVSHGEPAKTRPASSGSQKSVTFSDHVDEHSFQDLGRTPSTGSRLDEVAEEQDVDDDAFDIIDVHSSPSLDFDEITKPAHGGVSSHGVSLGASLDAVHSQRKSPAGENLSRVQRDRDGSPLEHDNGLISEAYLRRSPQSKPDLFTSKQSPFSNVFESGLDLSEAMSPDPSNRMHLLEDVSSMMTPSKTPKLGQRKSALYQGNISSGSPFNGLNLSSSHRTPDSLDNDLSFLRKGLTDLKLSTSSTRGGVVSKRTDAAAATTQRPVRNALEFSGLFGKW